MVAVSLFAASALGDNDRRAAASVSTPSTWAPNYCTGLSRYSWEQHPTTIAFACDGTATAIGLQWRQWGSATATATGTYVYASCTPNCAEAPRHRAAVTITASHIGYCGTRRVYGTITARFEPPSRLKPFSQPTYCNIEGGRPSRLAPAPTSNAPGFQALLAGAM